MFKTKQKTIEMDTVKKAIMPIEPTARNIHLT